MEPTLRKKPYRKVPKVDIAFQWFTVMGTGDGVYYTPEHGYYVVTIHGQITPIVDSDWVIEEPDHVHHYPCKDDIFRSNHEV